MRVLGPGSGSGQWRRSRRIDHPADNPRGFADPPVAGEAELFEEFDGRAEQEPAWRLAAGRHLGDGLDKTSACLGDLAERALARRPREALATVFRIDVEAGDPPIRARGRGLVVLALVFDGRQFLGAAILAPSPCQAVLVKHERGMRSIGPDPILLDCTVADPFLTAFRV